MGGLQGQGGATAWVKGGATAWVRGRATAWLGCLDFVNLIINFGNPYPNNTISSPSKIALPHTHLIHRHLPTPTHNTYPRSPYNTVSIPPPVFIPPYGNITSAILPPPCNITSPLTQYYLPPLLIF